VKIVNLYLRQPYPLALLRWLCFNLLAQLSQRPQRTLLLHALLSALLKCVWLCQGHAANNVDQPVYLSHQRGCRFNVYWDYGPRH
jgi:hypothetical protein